MVEIKAGMAEQTGSNEITTLTYIIKI